MDALPRPLDTDGRPQLSGLSCPECPGTLEVMPLGDKGALQFRCRIGHLYALKELLQAKEERVESALWGAVESLEELGDLLRDLEAHAARFGRDTVGGPYDGRAHRAHAHVGIVRAVIDENEPVVLRDGGSDGDP